MKNSRLFQIIEELMVHGQVTAPELAKKFEVSLRTLYRDIDTLCQAGAPIYTSRGRGGGIRLLEGYVMNKTLMTADEQSQLITAVKSMGLATQEDQSALLTKLRALFQQPPSHDWLEVNLAPWGASSSQDERFHLLKASVLEKRILYFCYSGERETSERRVKPARLVFKSCAWYLQAYCETRQDYRTFKLTRMRDLRLSQEHFAEELSPPPLESQDKVESLTIRLKFPNHMAYRVFDEFDEKSIAGLPSGELLVTTEMPDMSNWLLGYLLSFLGEVEVIAPPRLRQALAEKALQILKQYQNDADQI